jgi:hypothetical protein
MKLSWWKTPKASSIGYAVGQVGNLQRVGNPLLAAARLRRAILSHADVVLPAGLKEQQEVGQAHQLANPFAQVDQLKPAPSGLRRDVEAGDDAKARAVHLRDAGEVQNHVFGARQQSLNLRVQLTRGARDELARTLDHNGVIFRKRIQSEYGGGCGLVTGGHYS